MNPVTPEELFQIIGELFVKTQILAGNVKHLQDELKEVRAREVKNGECKNN